MSNQLFCGDCLEILPTLPAQSVDMVLADLPYQTTNCHWDVMIPFEPLWKEYKRLIKPRGAIVLFGSQPFTTMLIASNFEWFKYSWVWEKDQGVNFQLVNHQPLKTHEDVCVFSAEGHIYNPQDMRKVRIIKSNRAKSGNLGHLAGSEAKRAYYLQGFSNYPQSVQRFARETGLHPTQKPVALLAYLIRTYTNPGDTVLDNTMGSGSTLVACIQERRNGIGIEMDQHYFEVAQQRIATTQPPLPMPVDTPLPPPVQPALFAGVTV